MTRYLRFYRDGIETAGVIADDGAAVRPVVGDIFGEHRIEDDRIALEGLRFAPPVRPSKIVAVALNYLDHLGERPPPSNPELFLKPPSALIGHGDAIVLPAGSTRVDYEGELVAVIGRRIRGVTEEEAIDAVFGYTCGNDVSARDWQAGDKQWWRAKGADTFAPLGPWIETEIDVADIGLTTRVNGEERQATRTSLLLHPIGRVIAFAAAVMTLEPGDVIYTGTPGQTQPLAAGDLVEVDVEALGVLRNPVRPGHRS